ncbi:hypothetical protein ACFE04_007839 [Oxalis oulophora]
MMMFEDMGICSDLDFFSGQHLPEGDVVDSQPEQETAIDDEFSDEEIDVDELEKRMWRDKMRLKRLKEQTKPKDGLDMAKQRQSQEQARRKKMSRAQDGILKYMLKMMEVCKAQGFVYGIIPEKGKPVTGASDNLREWWKDKVRFDRNGPAAISKYMAENSIGGSKEGSNSLYPDSCPTLSSSGGSGSLVVSDCSEYDVVGPDDDSHFDVQEIKPELFGSSTSMMDVLPTRQYPYQNPIKGELANSDFIRKRKPTNDLQMVMDQKIYTCEFLHCPYSEMRLGFHDRNSRDNHQLTCPYRTGSSEFGGSNFHMNDVKPVVFPQQHFVQSKPMVNSVGQPSSFDLSALGVPDDGQKMIAELMSVYDNNIQGNLNPNTSSARVGQPQNQSDFFHGQGNINEAKLYGNSNMSENNHMFVRDGSQLNNQFKVLNTPFESNQNQTTINNNNNFQMMYGTPFVDLSTFDYKEDLQAMGVIDAFPKQENSLWFQ